MRLATEYFQKIANGTKAIECRLWDEKRQQLKAGDEIEFSDTNDEQKKAKTRIVALHRAASFAELLDQFPINKFGSESKEQMLAALKKFYSDEEEKKFGVVGIEVKLI